MEKCFCGSDKVFKECCSQFLDHKKFPETALELMRSRYSAFSKGDIEYIYDSHHPDTRKEVNKEEISAWSKHSKWLGLNIIKTEKGGKTDNVGTVEFLCIYEIESRKMEHHEKASFRKTDGRWYFFDGEILRGQVKRATPKIGRNDPCSCGSQKKYKKCCGA